MLDGAGTKKLNSKKMLNETVMEKVSLTQYIRRGWREKPLFTENAGQVWYRKSLN